MTSGAVVYSLYVYESVYDMTLYVIYKTSICHMLIILVHFVYYTTSMIIISTINIKAMLDNNNHYDVGP